MTGTLTGTYCRTCGYIYTEPVTGGTCPICKYYGRQGYLLPYEDTRWLRVVTLMTYIEDEQLKQSRRPRAVKTDAKMLKPTETTGETEQPGEVSRVKRPVPVWLMWLLILKMMLTRGKIE